MNVIEMEISGSQASGKTVTVNKLKEVLGATNVKITQTDKGVRTSFECDIHGTRTIYLIDEVTL